MQAIILKSYKSHKKRVHPYMLLLLILMPSFQQCKDLMENLYMAKLSNLAGNTEKLFSKVYKKWKYVCVCFFPHFWKTNQYIVGKLLMCVFPTFDKNMRCGNIYVPVQSHISKHLTYQYIVGKLLTLVFPIVDISIIIRNRNIFLSVPFDICKTVTNQHRVEEFLNYFFLIFVIKLNISNRNIFMSVPSHISK